MKNVLKFLRIYIKNMYFQKRLQYFDEYDMIFANKNKYYF